MVAQCWRRHGEHGALTRVGAHAGPTARPSRDQVNDQAMCVEPDFSTKRDQTLCSNHDAGAAFVRLGAHCLIAPCRKVRLRAQRLIPSANVCSAAAETPVVVQKRVGHRVIRLQVKRVSGRCGRHLVEAAATQAPRWPAGRGDRAGGVGRAAGRRDVGRGHLLLPSPGYLRSTRTDLAPHAYAAWNVGNFKQTQRQRVMLD
jgi:hypothetical protein